MELHLQDIYFKAIRAGEKTVEGRLAKEKYRLLSIGEKIVFVNDAGDRIEKKLKAIHVFGTFKEAFDVIPFTHAVPGIDNIENAVKVYETFYPITEQHQYGVVFLEIV